jgi:hypothetical protein
MSVHNDAVSSASAPSERWIATVAFHENASVGAADTFAEGVAALRNEVEGRYP